MKKLFISLLTIAATLNAAAITYNASANLKIVSGDGYDTNLIIAESSDYTTAMEIEPGNIIALYAMEGEKRCSRLCIASLGERALGFLATQSNSYTITCTAASGNALYLKNGENEPVQISTSMEPVVVNIEDAQKGTFVDDVLALVEAPVPPAADYTRSGLTAEHWYTICLPKASSSFVGMELYKVAGYVEGQGLAVDPVEGQMVAGMPYIFQATATEIGVMYTGEAADAQTANYLVGVLADEFVTPAVAYVVANNVLNWAAAGTPVPANRAYLAKEDITTLGAPTISAPGRKFIAPKAMPTELNEVAAGMADGTYMINGQVVLVKGGKMFNVLGL